MESHRKKFLWSLGGAYSPRGVPQVNCDHFGDCGELKIYPATKILTSVLKWWPTDLKKKKKRKTKINPWLNYQTDKHTQTDP